MIAIVLGSGLSDFSKHFENIKREKYARFLDFEFETLDGHERTYIWCRDEDVEFLVLSGKLHFYEGLDYREITAPLRWAIDHFEIDEVLVTSASGGLGQHIVNGRWTFLREVVSIPQVVLDQQITEEYDEAQVNRTKRTSAFDTLPIAVYGYHQGPSLGTNAEYRMLDGLGVDLVGMSMYPEYRFLTSAGVPCHFLSLPVCNYFPFESLEEPTFEEVLENSASAVDDLVRIFKQYLKTKEK